MLTRFTEFIIRIKWTVIVVWVAAALILLISAPKLSELIRTDSGSFLPSDSKTAQADTLIKSLFPDEARHTSLVLVANSGEKLTSADEDYIKALETYFDKNKSVLNIVKITSPYTNEALKSELISNDGKVALIYLSINAAPYTDESTTILHSVTDVVKAQKIEIDDVSYTSPENMDIYVTGDAAISSEQHQAVNESMGVVTNITIALLLIILVIIYRSPVASILPLFTIGLSFLVSRGIIGYLTMLDFKISTFTETFLIAVLFGAGTDYCMLIFSRFKEELSHGKDKKQALIDAMPKTGVAIISSGGTVIVGFLFMIFAQFGLFNTTGPSVAIGVVITILAVLTLIPALISILGDKIFWPTKNFNMHNNRLHSGFWAKFAALVTAKPIRFLLISFAIFLPFIILSTAIPISYDNMKDLPAESPSIKGFTVMSDHFSKGDLMPVRVTVKSDKDMMDISLLKTIDSITENLLKIDNVEAVRSASRPLGVKLTQASLGSQISLLSTGIGDVAQGFPLIISGLKTIQDGIGKIEKGLSDGSSLIRSDLSESVDMLQSGIGSTKDGLDELSGGTAQAAGGINEISGQLITLAKGAAMTSEGIKQVSGSIQSSISSLDNLLTSNPSLIANVDFQTAIGTLKAIAVNMAGIQQSLAQITGGVSQTVDGLNSVKSSLYTVSGGIDASSDALSEINSGLSAMKSGAASASAGIESAADSLKTISAGIDPINTSLEEMHSGLAQINEATDSYSGVLDDIFYLPSGVFSDYPLFEEAVMNYISPDKHGAVFDIVLSDTPYSTEALDTVSEINDTVEFSLKNTSLEGATFAVSGMTSIFDEVRSIIGDDLEVVIIFVLIGIFLVLAILLKSIVAPVYLLLTTVISFVSTLGITYLFFCKILGQDGLHWSVPFFSFCVLVALGIDYNIFLISRVKEEYIPGEMRQSITRALATTGGIITSCGIIMAGTFGSMMFSPMRPMMQVGFAACIGIIIDTFIIRTVVVPTIAVLFGEMSWWPGRKVYVTSSDRNKRLR